MCIMGKNIISEKWQQYRRKKRWWSIVLDFLFLALVVAMLFPTSRKTVSAFIVRYTMLAPRESSRTVILDQQERQLRLVTYDGELVTLEELSDKPVFLNYWATWCPPCIAEMPSLQNLYNAYKDEVHFVFVSNEDPETVLAFMEARGYELPLYALASQPAEALSTTTLPTTFLISPGGRIVLHKTGAARWDSRRMFDLLDKQLR